LAQHADRIAALLKKVAPDLKNFRAVPVDGIHPKYGSMIFGGSKDTWSVPLRFTSSSPDTFEQIQTIAMIHSTVYSLRSQYN